MDGGTSVKTIVYNTKKDSKGGTEKKRYGKRERGRERESKRVKKYNSKKDEFSTLSYSTRIGMMILLACVGM